MSTLRDALQSAGITTTQSKRFDCSTYTVRVDTKPRRRSKRFYSPAAVIAEAATPKPQRWADLDDMSRVLSDMSGALASVYPKIWGRSAASAYIYQVWRLCGNGNWSSMLRTHDREAALRLYHRTEGMERYIDMHNALTMELVGEMGRAGPEVEATLHQVLDDIESCDPYMETLVAISAWREGSQRQLIQDRNRLELLHHQAAALMALLYLPAESICI
jgi:hypothetical protein